MNAQSAPRRAQPRVPKPPFQVHEDELSDFDDDMSETQSYALRENEEYDENEDALDREDEDEEEGMEEDDHDDPCSDSSDGEEPIDATIQRDMDKLQNAFPRFREDYRLIKRIGEGTFSTVYKAEDVRYDYYNNRWDLDAHDDQWTPPPLMSTSLSRTNLQSRPRRRKPKFVAIKKIYVTSSPNRILNELELLHDLKDSPSVCPLITAFRQTDQVLAVLPYFRHQDFRKYYPTMDIPDVQIYLRSLFTALAAVHAKGIMHRDIKPTNFLYDPEKKRGVLVDFGLAEREGTETKPCLCHEDRQVRKQRLQQSVAFNSVHTGPQLGYPYPKSDTRPSRRANRAGTRGFRAPEVLFKCTEQTTKIDIWSAGVILLTILCKRFPFFNSADDIEATIEIATIFGTRRMKQAAQLHGCMFDTDIPTIGVQGFSFEKIMLWSTCRTDSPDKQMLDDDEKCAIEFLNRCMELDPTRRISAEEALQHDFLRMEADDGDVDLDDDQVMML